MDRERLEQEIRRLDEGRAVVELSAFRAVAVEGLEAASWLNDLVTADVARLETGAAARSLLLTPTGRIRADLHVLRRAEDHLLLQTRDQPANVAALLAPYVLSSDVRLAELSGDLGLLAIPGAGAWRFEPAAQVSEDLALVSAEAVEAWRIRRGVARFPLDMDEGSLPAEAGLDDGVVIDRAKGCYLGQESVAKVRNLGHPTRLVRALRATGPVAAGEPILVGDMETGVVTSADMHDGGTDLLARVRWEDRDAGLRTASGTPLEGR